MLNVKTDNKRLVCLFSQSVPRKKALLSHMTAQIRFSKLQLNKPQDVCNTDKSKMKMPMKLVIMHSNILSEDQTQHISTNAKTGNATLSEYLGLFHK